MSDLRILLAEDNVINQRLASKLLEKRGHQVTVTATGRGALERIQEQTFDVVLMDVQMPDMDGLEATALIRAWESHRGKRTPIIAVTAHSMQGDRERCLAAGMDGYVTKPFDADRLIEVVESTARARTDVTPAPAAGLGLAGRLHGGPARLLLARQVRHDSEHALENHNWAR